MHRTSATLQNRVNIYSMQRLSQEIQYDPSWYGSTEGTTVSTRASVHHKCTNRQLYVRAHGKTLCVQPDHTLQHRHSDIATLRCDTQARSIRGALHHRARLQMARSCTADACCTCAWLQLRCFCWPVMLCGQSYIHDKKHSWWW